MSRIDKQIDLMLLLDVWFEFTLTLCFLSLAQCQNGKWAQAEAYPNNIYYYAHRDDKIKFDDVSLRCNGLRAGARTVDITSAAEHYAINAAFPWDNTYRNSANRENALFWIGLQRDDTRILFFRWLTLSGVETCYTHWVDVNILKGGRRPSYVYYDFSVAAWDGTRNSDEMHLYMCEAINPCLDYCRNGGTCIINEMSGDREKCACPATHTGDRCETHVRCISSGCFGGGTCVTTGNTYQCNCPANVDGSLCEMDVDECDTNIVEAFCSISGGICRNFHGGFTCECLAGFRGDACTDRVSSCQDDPCRNGATCVSNNANANGVECRCMPGYVGTFCEFGKYDCLSEPCQNGGICVERIIGQGYDCECTAYFSGSMCETDVDECTDLSYCPEFGCTNSFGSYSCDCPTGYAGPRCLDDVDECLENFNSCFGRGRCLNVVGSYSCECIGDFDWSTFCALPSSVCEAARFSESEEQTAVVRTTNDTVLMFIIVLEVVVVAGLTYMILRKTRLEHKNNVRTPTVTQTQKQ